jgi:hypothetical protein
MNSTEVNGNWNDQKGKLKQKFAVLITMIFVFAFVFATESFAQGGMNRKGSGGWGTGTQYGRMYDPKTVETIVGVVVRVEKIIPTKGMSNGVHLIVKTDKETVSVHLGPAWYIDNQDIKIDPKDKIEVKGSRITFDGKPAIIAAEVKKGNEILELRNENGIPSWSGWKRR